MVFRINCAVLAGAFASAASLFGKLAGLSAIENFFLLRLLCFGLMVACNAGVWTFFVKALQQMETSLKPTVISAATNYCISAFIGYFIFGEVTTILWWSGMFCIICGLVFILKDAEEEQKLE